MDQLKINIGYWKSRFQSRIGMGKKRPRISASRLDLKQPALNVFRYLNFTFRQVTLANCPHIIIIIIIYSYITLLSFSFFNCLALLGSQFVALPSMDKKEKVMLLAKKRIQPFSAMIAIPPNSQDSKKVNNVLETKFSNQGKSSCMYANKLVHNYHFDVTGGITLSPSHASSFACIQFVIPYLDDFGQRSELIARSNLRNLHA